MIMKFENQSKILSLQKFLLQCSMDNHFNELKEEDALLLNALHIAFIEHTSKQIIKEHYSTKK